VNPPSPDNPCGGANVHAPAHKHPRNGTTNAQTNPLPNLTFSCMEAPNELFLGIANARPKHF
jgi:hypothetical protein